jgi:hypothetical protein
MKSRKKATPSRPKGIGIEEAFDIEEVRKEMWMEARKLATSREMNGEPRYIV